MFRGGVFGGGDWNGNGDDGNFRWLGGERIGDDVWSDVRKRGRLACFWRFDRLGRFCFRVGGLGGCLGIGVAVGKGVAGDVAAWVIGRRGGLAWIAAAAEMERWCARFV